MKKILYTLPCSLVILTIFNVVSCSNTSTKINDKEFKKTIIKDESIENLIKRIKNNVNFFNKQEITKEEFEREMKKILKEEMIVDTNSQIYKELERLNKIEEFKSQYIDESYDSLLEEIRNEMDNINARHWIGFFKDHSWKTIIRKLQALSLNLLAITDLTLQLAPAIVIFIKNGDANALSEALATFDGRFTNITQNLFVKGIEDLRNWKIKTKCKSKFYIWGQIL